MSQYIMEYFCGMQLQVNHKMKLLRSNKLQ